MGKEEELISRADFLRKGFKLFVKHVSKAVNENVKDKAGKFTTPLIRPPGAVDEIKFLLRCTRCDLCAQACPHQAIVKAEAETGSAIGTPVIHPEEHPCQMCKDFPCIRACPEEALLPVQSLKIGSAYITLSKCFAHTGQICDYCHDCCPEKDKAIILENGKPQVISDKCTGCGICEFYCPAPGKAIRVVPGRRG